MDSSSTKSTLDPVRDLLRTPRPRPILAVRLVVPGPPRRLRSPDRGAVGPMDLPRQPLLDVGVQPRVGEELCGLRTSCSVVGLPLRNRRPVVEPSAPRGSVAA